MRRIKRDRIKTEKVESSSASAGQDLAYHIHDRVALMQQVFAILKYRDLKVMAPECVRSLPIGDLQELCTEELLGISSKRLLAVLDGAEPPSDTESSGSDSPSHLETISLDSISSDEEILCQQASKKKKHKHKRRDSKTKAKKHNKKKQADTATDNQTETQTEESKASRAGLTVLELLELQARARAIRAQLHNDHDKRAASGIRSRPSCAAADGDEHLSEDSVEIKEEKADVVEISSEDEKPDPASLDPPPSVLDPGKKHSPAKLKPVQTSTSTEAAGPPHMMIDKQPTQTSAALQIDSQTVTRRVNDLVITVPQPKAARKVKLNRSNFTVTVPIVKVAEPPQPLPLTLPQIAEQPSDRKKPKKKRKKNVDKEGSDHDEITIQLSDSEKMDLLEDLNEKNYEKLSSSSDSDSSDTENEKEGPAKETIQSSVVKVQDFRNGKEKDTLNAENKIQSVVKVNGKEKKGASKIQSSEIKVSVTDGKDIQEKQEKTSNSDVNVAEIEIQSSTTDGKNCVEIGDSETDKARSNDKMSRSEGDNETGSVHITVSVEETSIEVTNVDLISEVNDPELAIEVNEGSAKEAESIENASTAVHTSVGDATVDTKEPKNGTNIVKSSEEVRSEQEPETEKAIEVRTVQDRPVVNEETSTEAGLEVENNLQKATDEESKREVSEGELSDRESSGVEAFDVEPEVVCISDDEENKKKKKKKDKKSKKMKKSKKKDFCERADQNFYKDADHLPPEIIDNVETNLADTELSTVAVDITHDESTETRNRQVIDHYDAEATIDLTDDEVYEILELSDDSSCYEVEGTILSKEPTAQEIEALSARIDQIKREDIERGVNELGGNLPQDLEISKGLENDEEHGTIDSEKAKSDNESDQELHVSWKDRYLDSKKVKKVLTTANILNALRKKNKELKRKIEESKKREREEDNMDNVAETKPEDPPLEGSIEHYKTLLGSTRYVDPVREDHVEEQTTGTGDEEEQSANATDGEVKEVTKNTADGDTVTKEMKKDAKQLIKMYRKLLKYNDITKTRDPLKKKKTKKKKRENKE